MRLILSSLRFGTINSIESFRELLSTRSKRAMTTLRSGPDVPEGSRSGVLDKRERTEISGRASRKSRIISPGKDTDHVAAQ